MNLIISLIVSLLFVYFFRKSILKHSPYYYLASAIIAVFTAYGTLTGSHMALPNTLRTFLVFPFSKGAIATALFIIVMYVGCLPRKSKSFKALMPIRAELSIMASILMLGHNVGYSKRYFGALLSGKNLPINFFYASIASLIMIAIMLPLFITSFKTIRRKMRPKSWTKLQKLAYIFYGLIWVHVLCIYYPSALKESIKAILTIAVYHIIFVSYAFIRIRKARCDKNRADYTFSLNKALLTSLLTLCVVIFPIFKHTVLDHSEVSSTTIEAVQATQTSAQDNTQTSAENSSSSSPQNTSLSDDNISKEVTSSSNTEIASSNESNSKTLYKDGEYEASAYGYVDQIVVKVTIENSVISKIDVLEDYEDYEYMVFALEIIDDIVAQNSADVDSISGATTSANAIKFAVKKALKQAEVSD